MRFAYVLALTACAAAARPRAHGDELVGLWGAEREVSAQTGGRLTLSHANAAWTASIGDATTALVPDGTWLRGRLGTGELRIRVDRDQISDAFWIQQPGVAQTAAFATPLALTPSLGGYVADVVPLPDELRFYLSIRASATGSLTAFVREPGFNLGRMLGDLSVARRGAAITFAKADGSVALHGAIDARGLHVIADGAGIELDLTRRDRASAPGFYPRPTTEPYRERVPAPGDGWPTGTLASVGLRADPIRALVQQILDAVPTSWSSPAVHALLIARHGTLVVDEYFDGFTADTPHDTRSAGKSWTSTLAGVAVDRDELAVTSKLAPDATDPRKAQITLEHLLTMTSGLACDDDDDASPGNEDAMQNQKGEPDWQRYALALPMIRVPGERAVYCSGAINLIGAMLARGGEWIPARWVHDLAEPLGLAHFYLNLMPNGQGYLAGGTRTRARDFAKLAQVFLDHGTWRGRRIVSAAWVAAAIAPHAAIHAPGDYGYGWWRITYHVGDRDIAAFYASGNGGQVAIAIPELDIVVAIMAGNYNNAPTWRRYVEDWIPRYVIPAAL